VCKKGTELYWEDHDVTTTQLKQDLDQAVATLQQADANLPGAAQANKIMTAIQQACETPLIINILAAILTSRGF
jgi:hypothetical protein